MDFDIWIWVTKKNTESISIIVATEKCINIFEKCGFAEFDKWSTFIRDAVENPPSIYDLPEEYQSAYDHIGLKPMPKRKSKKGKIYASPFLCSYCNTEYTSKYSDSAKIHMAAEIWMSCQIPNEILETYSLQESTFLWSKFLLISRRDYIFYLQSLWKYLKTSGILFGYSYSNVTIHEECQF